MIDWSSCPAVEQDPERYSGAIVRTVITRSGGIVWVILLPRACMLPPRAAANDRRMRPRLETLLKDLEQREASRPMVGFLAV